MLPRLRSLTLEIPENDTLAGVGELTHLEELTVRSVAISSDDLVELKRLRYLRDLSFEAAQRKHMTKLDFSQWPALRALRLSSIQLSSDEWNSIFGNEGLVRLMLQDMVLFSAQFKQLGRLKNLQALHFDNVRLDSGMSIDLSTLPELEYLSFINSTAVDRDVNQLAKLRRLRQLVLECTCVSESEVVGRVKTENGVG